MKVTKVLKFGALQSLGHSKRCCGTHVGWSHRTTIWRSAVRRTNGTAIMPFADRPAELRAAALEAVKDHVCTCFVNPSPELVAKWQAARVKGAATRSQNLVFYQLAKVLSRELGTKFKFTSRRDEHWKSYHGSLSGEITRPDGTSAPITFIWHSPEDDAPPLKRKVDIRFDNYLIDGVTLHTKGADGNVREPQDVTELVAVLRKYMTAMMNRSNPGTLRVE